MKIHDENIERLALTLLQGLMLRHGQDGYTDRDAIGEAFHLAEEYYTAPIVQQPLSGSETKVSSPKVCPKCIGSGRIYMSAEDSVGFKCKKCNGKGQTF